MFPNAVLVALDEALQSFGSFDWDGLALDLLFWFG